MQTCRLKYVLYKTRPCSVERINGSINTTATVYLIYFSLQNFPCLTCLYENSHPYLKLHPYFASHTGNIMAVLFHKQNI